MAEALMPSVSSVGWVCRRSFANQEGPVEVEMSAQGAVSDNEGAHWN